MTKPPDDPREIARLRERVAYLEEVTRWHLFALDLMGTMGDFYGDTRPSREPSDIFQMASQFLKRVLDFRILAFYAVDEADSSFALKYCEPAGAQETIRKAVDRQIDSGIFAWALNQNRAIVVNDSETGSKLIFHVIATRLRLRGMFVGMVSETYAHDHLDLLSMMVHSTSHMLEGVSLYDLISEKNHGLEDAIEQRTADLKKQTGLLQNEIAERIQAEKKLKERGIRLRTIINSAADGVITIDERGAIESFNPAAERLFGYTWAEVVGQNISLVMPEPHKSAHDGYLRDYARTGQGKIIGKGPRELVGLRKDGTTVPLDVAISEILLEDRRMFLGVLRDISERKQAEAVLAEYQNHLQKLVEERTAELKATHEQLRHSEKLSAIGKLSASLAHEFNNPLYGIKNVLESVRESASMDEELADLVLLACRECDRVSGLVRKLQDFNRPSTEIPVIMDIHEILNDMILLMSKKLAKRRIGIETHYDSQVSDIEIVPDQIKQVILNLLQNAEEAIPPEGGQITVATESLDSRVKIHVRDTGCGIPPKNMKNIFDPFFTTKAAVKGTGLGLSVSYGIIKAHGGDIAVESRPGEGTAFTLILPVRRPCDES